MLLDNVVELLLRIEFQNHEARNTLWRQMERHIQACLDSGDSALIEVGKRQQREMKEEGYLSRQEEAQIKNDFNRLVGHAAENKLFPNSYAPILRRLHRYRNEAYHEDSVRPGTIETAAKIYTWIACDIMKRISPGMVRLGGGPDDLRDLRDLYPSIDPSSISGRFLTQYATQLLSDSPVEDTDEFAEILSEHLESRLDELDENLVYVVSRGNLMSANFQSQQDRTKVFQKFIDESNSLSGLTGEPPLRFAAKRLNEWRAAADRISDTVNHIAAFERFANIEIALEQVEEVVREAVWAVDSAIEEEIDRRRGN